LGCIITGTVDLMNDNTIIEIKTTATPFRYYDYYKKQCGLYLYLAYQVFRKEFSGFVYVYNTNNGYVDILDCEPWFDRDTILNYAKIIDETIRNYNEYLQQTFKDKTHIAENFKIDAVKDTGIMPQKVISTLNIYKQFKIKLEDALSYITGSQVKQLDEERFIIDNYVVTLGKTVVFQKMYF